MAFAQEKTPYFPEIGAIRSAAKTIGKVAERTPLQYSIRLSRQYECEVYLKREDLQRVRSYKIRGAFNKISSLGPTQLRTGVACASAGNHAQGVAFACHHLKVRGHIFMPEVTPRQKVDQTRLFGADWVTIHLAGDTYDDAFEAAREYCTSHDLNFIHPFDDPRIIEGQATVGLEIVEDLGDTVDFVLAAIGGGGLASGLIGLFSELSPTTRIVGIEPAGAPSMKRSIEQGRRVSLDQMSKFVDGAAVKMVGELTFEICRRHLEQVVLVEDGAVCQSILTLYNRDAIVVEPAGALGIAALDQIRDQIRGKRIVVVVGGSNNDISRMAEIKERALLYTGLKHYFIVRFPQRPGALKEFVGCIPGPDDDITFFEYSKKSDRENAPAVVGIELQRVEDLQPLINRMKENSFFGEYLNDKPDLFQYII